MPPSDADRVDLSTSDTTVEVLDGAVSARLLHLPDRSFTIEATLDLGKGARFFGQKPPLHFHVQEEYIECTQGKLGLEFVRGRGRGEELVLTPADGRVAIPPYVDHRSYPMPPALQDDDGGAAAAVVKFLLSAERTDAVFELNPAFFENWYRYQDEVVATGARVDLVQVLCTFDAGGTYVSLPWWVPFRQTASIALGVVVGRWIGSGLLGYQPFYRKWTTDWESACRKMETSVFQRRFSDRAKTD
ncbi:putative 4-hydroxybenzoate polyprenyl transferase [Rosellinia necatrix]|uniref:Putative 4-hydroxybenzoate polyprenyl transferase n=1 Tax=Rosellinia necatrix TaxID=77044 RepID=A0A1S7UP25_ROSNE|nr:putative 4-hydroxybenzoate polyprenyl transferase [Rosellinia necatrix]